MFDAQYYYIRIAESLYFVGLAVDESVIISADPSKAMRWKDGINNARDAHACYRDVVSYLKNGVNVRLVSGRQYEQIEAQN